MIKLILSYIKRSDQKSLIKIANKRHQKEWNIILNDISRKVKASAKAGGYNYKIPIGQIMVEHNKRRTILDITDDFKSLFKGCNVYLDATVGNNQFIKIEWNVDIQKK